MNMNEVVIWAALSIFGIVLVIELGFLTIKFPKTAMLFIFFALSLFVFYYGDWK